MIMATFWKLTVGCTTRELFDKNFIDILEKLSYYGRFNSACEYFKNFLHQHSISAFSAMSSKGTIFVAPKKWTGMHGICFVEEYVELAKMYDQLDANCDIYIA